ncbi:MAG: hypothetical protein IT259_14310 [Saprospiraceae bacterium]|nr:hypothetical protein [Saprospiraceae bacterium]
MKYEQISALLEKYWDGDTSLEEERLLKAYFSAGQIDERLRQIAPLFAAIRQEQAVEWQRDTVMKVQAGPSVVWRRLAAAAAALVLLAAGWWWLSQPVVPDQNLPLADNDTKLETPADLPKAENLPATPAPTVALQASVQPAKPRIAKKTVKTLTEEPAVSDAETEKALEEIKAALSLISSKLNKGKREATKNLHEIQTLDKVIKTPSEG